MIITRCSSLRERLALEKLHKFRSSCTRLATVMAIKSEYNKYNDIVLEKK